MAEQLDRLLSIMARLRDPENGCEWDLAQNFSTIAPYTIEEAYEVADAISRGSMAELRGELGDLLLQVVFHARMAEENGDFAFEDVARGIADKMEARHPHIFSLEQNVDTEEQPLDGSSAAVRKRWEDLKAEERLAQGQSSAMDGVARALPAIMRAEKLQKRAARDGFDWPDTSGPEAKVLEEIAELREASSETQMEEAGDLLFAAVNLVRAYGLDAEQALRLANDKFENRYRGIEAKAGGTIAGLDLDAQEALWQDVKKDEIKT